MKKNYNLDLTNDLICFTGTLMLGTRSDAIELVNSCGGQGTEKFSRNVSILVCGYGPGRAKLQQAKVYGTTIMSEQEFLEYVNGRRATGRKIPMDIIVTPENSNIRSFNFED